MNPHRIEVTPSKNQLNNYEILDILHVGAKSLVYRAQRTCDYKPVILKLLRNEYPSFNELIQFRHQYTITKNLNLPGIVQPLALENYRNSLLLVMPDTSCTALSEYIKTHSLSLTQFLKIAIALATILEGLYHHRIIHKDIKPANILIHPATFEIKLIDFSIASLLPKETQEIKNPDILEGTLAYISPEQTGRMNRGIDYRTDFYSLGVTLYELLTGKLPFHSTDAMELVHCHIAKNAPALQELTDQDIPDSVAQIIMKLMAKNAEDRYQSAWGLKFDLEKCLSQLQNNRKIEKFDIGTRDIIDRFVIPEKLYGREAQVKQLLEAFSRVSEGKNLKVTQESDGTSISFPDSREGFQEGESQLSVLSPDQTSKSEMILVAGYSGVGKTAVVNEVHKPIVKQRGYFIKGKYDQFKRNIPLSAFVQAFQNLIVQLLSENNVKLQQWKNKILAALGENGQVIIDVIPELEKIIGQQQPVAELSGTAAQNRFNLLFQKLIQVFTTKEHPLVIFLDDLQWADSASLNLIKFLMSGSDSSYLLLIGAYRNNEVDPAHPLMLTLDEIHKNQAIVNTIPLEPLQQYDLNQLVADTLHCSFKQALPLAQAVYQKTKGNPFFTTQFLKALYEDELIYFNSEEGFWECDLAQVKQAAVSEDVVDFVSKRLQKLSPLTQDALKMAACIGNQFDLETLAIVRQTSEVETATDLWLALKEGLILPTTEVYKFYTDEATEIHPDQTGNHVSGNYRFLHDRIQQAAYSLIPEDQKQITHYHIGQLLLQKISPEAREERIFELVSQLNYGTALITEQKERDELAKLNLIACRKARSATAYQAGREYVRIGLSLLGENTWQRQYDMSLVFHELGAEFAWLCGDFEVMEKFIYSVVKQANLLFDKITVYRIKIQSCFAKNNLIEAMDIAQKILQKLGIIFPESPTKNHIQHSITEIEQLIGNRNIEDLLHLPLMEDPEKIAIIQITKSIIPAAYFLGSPLHPLLIALVVKLSIQYGNTEASPVGYVGYGFLACHLLQEINTGVKFGQLALQLVYKLDATAVKPEVLLHVGALISYRKFHVKELLPLLQEGYMAAIEVGNQEMAGHNAHCFCLNSFWCSQPLTTLEQQTRTYYTGLVQFNQLTTANYCKIYWQSVLNLLGFAQHPTVLSGEAFQESESLPKLLSNHDLYGLYIFYLYKLMLDYLFGEIESAKKQAIEIRNYLIGGVGTIGEPVFYFYDSLTAIANFNSPFQEESDTFEQVEKNQIILQQHWANHAPMNYQHKVDLVQAEKHRVLDKKLEAMELYDKAIAGAKENEYIQEEALANELAAKFYLDLGREKVAQTYMIEAYYCYAHWGAKAKVNDLEQRYPKLLSPILEQKKMSLNSFKTIASLGQTISQTQASISSNTTGISEALDFSSVMKASQALSSEMELGKLIANLMQVMLENAGASDGSLILLEEGILVIQAQSKGYNNYCHLESFPVESSDEIPQTIINSVYRTQEVLVINDFKTETGFATDAYLLRNQPQSILCIPIINQGKFIGILYLENKQIKGAFTEERIEVLKLLCSQAAISLENAQLYQKSQNYAQQLEQSLKDLQEAQIQLVQSEKMSALGQMMAGISHEINNPVGFIAGNLSPAEEYLQDLIEHLNLYQEEL